MTKLKLFVWTNYCPDYTSGLAFAIAKDETEARELIQKMKSYEIYNWGDLQILPLNEPCAFQVAGGG